jgi:demethylmenaquinone methyltransferase/2-methoxy-6-polyprenyl-1,4-benzoquinol methylase
LLKRFDGIGAITAVDISSGMHRRAMERLHAHRAHRIEFIEDDVLASEPPAESADFVISTFGLKTFNPEQHARLAALIARVLKPGGVFSTIEASDPKGGGCGRCICSISRSSCRSSSASCFAARRISR